MAAAARRDELIASLHFACAAHAWAAVAWVALPNHYHCLLLAPEEVGTLSRLLKSMHRFTARRWNKEDGAPGRQVWYQYWDTCIDSVGSFYARVNYIHHNPVKHGRVREPAEYPHSSYLRWRDSEDLDLGEIESAYPWERLSIEL